MSREAPEKVTSVREVYRGRIVTLKVKDVTLPSGRQRTRDIVEHPGAVVIVAPDGAGRVAMVRQYRSAIDRFLLEVPAGTREIGENAADCARRELQEEIGVDAVSWFPLIEFYSAPGFCTELLSVFVATNHSPSDTRPEEDESIDRLWLPIDSIPELISSRQLVDAKSIAALLCFRDIDRSGAAPWRA